MTKTFKINFCDEDYDLLLIEENYTNGRLAIRAICDNETWGVLTVNIPEAELEEDEIVVKTYSENKEWATQLIQKLPETFIPTGKTVKTGFVECPIYKYVRN